MLSKVSSKAAGPLVYFPNILFTLYRAPNLLKNQAAFKIPTFLNKYDIKQYLEKLYNVSVSEIVTINYIGKVKRKGMKFVAEPKWKKAVVTFHDEFKYPVDDTQLLREQAELERENMKKQEKLAKERPDKK